MVMKTIGRLWALCIIASGAERLSDLLAFVFEKPKRITEKIRVCVEMQNDVGKEWIAVFLRIDIGFPGKIFPWLAEKRKFLGSGTVGILTWVPGSTTGNR